MTIPCCSASRNTVSTADFSHLTGALKRIVGLRCKLPAARPTVRKLNPGPEFIHSGTRSQQSKCRALLYSARWLPSAEQVQQLVQSPAHNSKAVVHSRFPTLPNASRAQFSNSLPKLYGRQTLLKSPTLTGGGLEPSLSPGVAVNRTGVAINRTGGTHKKRKLNSWAGSQCGQ